MIGKSPNTVSDIRKGFPDGIHLCCKNVVILGKTMAKMWKCWKHHFHIFGSESRIFWFFLFTQKLYIICFYLLWFIFPLLKCCGRGNVYQLGEWILHPGRLKNTGWDRVVVLVEILCRWTKFGCWRIYIIMFFYGRIFWQLTRNRQVSTPIIFCYIQMYMYMFIFVPFVFVFISFVFSLCIGEFNKYQEMATLSTFCIFLCFWI